MNRDRRHPITLMLLAGSLLVLQICLPGLPQEAISAEPVTPSTTKGKVFLTQKKVVKPELTVTSESTDVLQRLDRIERRLSEDTSARAEAQKAAGHHEAVEQTIVTRIETLKKKLDQATTSTHPERESLWKALGLRVSGFIDAAYTHNLNNPNTNLNQLRIFDTNANAFMPHLAQVVVERAADPNGSGMDRAGFRARLNFGLDSCVTRARTTFQPGVSNDEINFQELYAQYVVPVGNGLDVEFGKMNTLIGYEVINSW